jgi:hypothetical protein
MPDVTVARGATIKNDDDIKINHHQKAKNPELAASLWKTTPGRLRRRRKNRHPWLKSVACRGSMPL